MLETRSIGETRIYDYHLGDQALIRQYTFGDTNSIIRADRYLYISSQQLLTIVDLETGETLLERPWDSNTESNRSIAPDGTRYAFRRGDQVIIASLLDQTEITIDLTGNTP